MINNVLLKIVQILILIVGLVLLGAFFYNLIFVQLTVKSIILRLIVGIIGIAVWIRFFLYIVRKFKKYF